MIFVHKARLEEKEDHIVVRCEIDVNSIARELWFQVERKYCSYLTHERGDAFLLLLLYYAMKTHQDMEFESPITERLLYQVNFYLMDALHKANGAFKQVDIRCRTIATPYEKGTMVGAGMSCGVDSLATLCAHNNKMLDTYRITLLTFFDVGAFQHDDGLRVGGIQNALFEQQLAQAESCATDARLPLMVVRSNLGELFPEQHARVHSYRNCGTALLFQKLFRTYYYSSGTLTNEFCCSPDVDSAYYDLYSLQMFSTENITFYSYTPSHGRLEKVLSLKDYSLAQQYLQVCTREGRNCGTCAKCAKTLIELDAVDALSDFITVFDLQKYRQTRTMQIGYAIAKKHISYYKEVYPILKRKGKIPLLSWLYAFIFIVLTPLEQFLKMRSPEGKRKAVALAKRLHINVPW